MTSLQFYGEFYDRLKSIKVPKCVELRTLPNAIKLRFKKVYLLKLYLRNFILKYDVIHDALKVICNKNIKRLRNFGDIGSFGGIGTGRKLAKNREIT